MKIEICDLCKKVPNLDMQIVKMIAFEAGEDIFGRPRRERVVCYECFNKIFNPHAQSK